MKKGSKRCDYCNNEATQEICVCPTHLKALDQFTSRARDRKLRKEKK